MRDILTILACLLVALLTAALVGPHFVNWTAQRSLIERRLSEATGAKVRIDGPINLELLPTPSLSVGRITAESGDPSGPSIVARRADFELAIAPLLRGEIQFLRADIASPRLQLRLGVDGGLSLPGAPTGLPRKLAFESLRVTDGRLVIDRGAGASKLSIAHVYLDAQAASLDGPFSGSGRIGSGPQSIRFQFATGARDKDDLAIRATIAFRGADRRAAFDGALHFAAADSRTKVAYSGDVSLQGVQALRQLRPIAWRLVGKLAANAAGAKLSAGDVTIGEGPSALSATTKGSFVFGAAPRVNLAAKAQQLDLDRFLASTGNNAAATLRRGLLDFINNGATGFLVRTRTALSIDSPAVVLGGATLTGLSARMTSGHNAVGIAFSANGPGGSHARIDGSLETGPAAVFRGRVDLGAEDGARAADWLAPVLPSLAKTIKAQPFRAVGVAGDLDLSAASFDIRHLKLTADQNALRGSAAYTEALAGRPARLFATLRSKALRLDALPDMSGLAASAAGVDLDLSLDARAVRLARFGSGMIDSGHIAVRLVRTGGDFELQKFKLADIGGATFSATGAASAVGARFQANLDASRLDGLAELVSHIAPGPFSRALAARAIVLSPAHLSLTLTAIRNAAGTYRPTRIALAGSARGVTIDGELVPENNDFKKISAQLELKGPDSSILLRQIGLEALPIADVGRGSVHLKMSGDPRASLKTTMNARVAGSDLTFHGDLVGGFGVDVAKGRVDFESADAAPLLRLLTVALPDLTLGMPANLSANVKVDARGASFSGISGTFGGARTAGRLSIRRQNSKPTIKGSLSLDRLSLADLASLALGPPPNAASSPAWSSSNFGAGAVEPPATDVALAVARLGIGANFTGRSARFRLQLSNGGLFLKSIDMRLRGGRLSGDLTLRRNGPSAAVAGRISVDKIILAEPFLSGLLSGEAQFAGTGRSPLELVDGLAGTGAFAIADGVIPKSDPAALARVISLAGAKGFSVDEARINNALRRQFDRAPLSFGAAALQATIADGAIRLSTAPKDSLQIGAATAAVGVDVDIRTGRAKERIKIADEKRPQDWPSKTTPQVDVIWRQPLAAGRPTRSIESAELVADLSARAIARETARIKAMEDDIRERAFFNRRLEGLRFLHKRERQESAFEAEQARKRAAAAAEAKAAAEAAAQAAGQNSRSQPGAAKPLPQARKPTNLGVDGAPLIPPPAPPGAPAGLTPDPLSAGQF